MINILIGMLISFAIIGTVNFILVYVMKVDGYNDKFIAWTIGLGWFWYWFINIFGILPTAIYGWFKCGILIGVGGSPAHFFVYVKNPLKYFLVHKAIKNKSLYSFNIFYFPLDCSNSAKKRKFEMLSGIKKHKATECKHILYV